MPRPTYIADLSASDYPRFREHDPTLPEQHVVWQAAVAGRVHALRRQGANPILFPISFDAMAERNGMLGIASFNRADRDDYAEERAAADVLLDRL